MPPHSAGSNLLRRTSRSSSSTAAEMSHRAQLVSKRVAIVCLFVIALLVLLVLALLYGVIVFPAKRVRRRFAGKKDDEVFTNDWWGLHAGDDFKAREKRRPKEVNMRKGVELHTCYITTRDGVKLAVDVWIPSKALSERGSLPVVFHQARYYRSATLRWPFSLIVNGGKPISFINDPFFKSFLSHDMILVSVDVRGTGASFGTHPGPWSPEEQQDSMEVLDWIDRQSWSSGNVALWGASYEGTSAFFTSLLRHPTVVCCCPMFFFWDVFDDVSHPGGVPMKHFSHNWQGFNDSLDSGWVQSTGWMARIFLEGVTPVTPEDSWGYQANQAIIGHKDNWSILKDDHIRFMDDTSKHTGRMVSSACVNQAVHELLAAQGFSEAAPSSPSPSTSAAKVLSSPSPEAGPGVSKRESAEAGAPLIEPATGNGDQNGTRHRNAAESAGTSLPSVAAALETEEGGGAEEDFLSGGAIAGGNTGGCSDAPTSAGDDGVSLAAAAATAGAVRGPTMTGEDGGSLAGVAAAAGDMLGGDVGDGEEPGGGQGGNVGGGGRRSSPGTAGRLEETLPFYLHVSGWLDASAHAAVMAFMTLPCRGAELLVGPWNHGGHQHVRPHHITTRSKFDFRTEVSGFFVRCLSSTPERLSREGGSEPAGDSSPPDQTDGGDSSKVTTASPSPKPDTALHTPSPDGAGASDGASDNGDEDCGRPSSSGYKAMRSSGPNNPQCPGVGFVTQNHGVPASNRSEMSRSASPLHRKDGNHADAGDEPHGANVARDTAEGTWFSFSPTQPPKPNPDATAAATAPLLTGAGAGMQAVAEVADVVAESKETEALWKKARPRVRFFTHQAEQWHEANTFPSIPRNKDDVALFLGKRLTGTPHPQPFTPTGTPNYLSASASSFSAAAADSTTTGGSALGTGPSAEERRSDEPCTTVRGVNCAGLPASETNTAAGGLAEDHRGVGTGTVSEAGRQTDATDGEEWDGDMIDEHVEEEPEVDDETDGSGAGAPSCSSEGEHSAEGESAEGGADPARPRGVGMRKRLSSRLANWPPFRKPKLTLSQDSHGEEELHELTVDLENDRDGEGVSRWAAMTEFLSLISYQMDGLRSNHLRFTSPPLKHDMEVTGYPIVTLWVSAADDLANLDVFVYLQAVKPRTGLSIYVTEGCFRAEHRKEAGRRRPVDVRALPGVPIHSYRRVDAQPLEEGRPVELKFKLMPTSFKFLKGQRMRLSIGGADARHFHPITRALPSNHDQVSCVDGRDESSTDPLVDSRRAAPAVAGANIAGTDHGANVTRRVLRVHTGGVYASGVSLPVPRNDGVGSGQQGRLVGEEPGGEEVAGRAGIDREGVAVDCQGARSNVAPPRTASSVARNLRERRPCSLPSSGFSAVDTGNAPPQQRRWAGVGSLVYPRSEGWLPLTHGHTHTGTTDEKEESRMFEDW